MALLGVALLLAPVRAQAGVQYAAPTGGWRYTYQGIFNPGIDGLPPGYGTKGDEQALDGTWSHDQSDKWDGSGPGEIGPPPYGPAPGGAEALRDGGTTYLRIQDTGNPELHGYVQGAQDPINTNRRVFFGHVMRQDGTVPNQLVLDNGVTISFRARVPIAGPLDPVYTADAGGTPQIVPWLDPPEEPTGRGYPIINDGRGMFNVVQNNPAMGFNIDSSLGFSLITSGDIADICGLGATGELGVHCASAEEGENPSGGLIMNNRAGAASSNDVDTLDFLTPGFSGGLNLLPIDDADLHDWREFWITIQKENGPGTHTISVYTDGSLTPSFFHVTSNPDNQAEYTDDAWITMGLSSTEAFGSVDVDFFSYALGVHAPMLNVLGDMDCDGDVDFDDIDDFVLGLNNVQLYESQFGLPPWVKGDTDGDEDLDFDDILGFVNLLQGGLQSVPEPSSALLLGCGAAAGIAACRCRRRSRRS
jgi:hypothetical protein